MLGSRAAVQPSHDPLCQVQWPHCALEPQLPAQGGVQQAVAALERAREHAAVGGRVAIMILAWVEGVE